MANLVKVLGCMFACVIVVIGFIVSMTGISTVYWNSGDTKIINSDRTLQLNGGLWTLCATGSTTDYDEGDEGPTVDELNTCGFLGLILSKYIHGGSFACT